MSTGNDYVTDTWPFSEDDDLSLSETGAIHAIPPPCDVDEESVTALGLEGSTVTGGSARATVLDIVSALIGTGVSGRLLSKDRVAFKSPPGPKPDMFVMDESFRYSPNERVDSVHVWAAASGVILWEAEGSEDLARKCIGKMLATCRWRDSVVVVVLSLTAVQSFVWNVHADPLGIETARMDLCEVERDAIAEVEYHGLMLLRWALGIMRSASLPPTLARAIVRRASNGAHDEVCSETEDTRDTLYADAVRMQLLGEVTGGKAFALSLRGVLSPVYHLKYVCWDDKEHFEMEQDALKVLQKARRASFPSLVAHDTHSRGLLTTPVIDTFWPTLPIETKAPRRMGGMGFAAYAPLVEDLKAIHCVELNETESDEDSALRFWGIDERPARLFHCDVGPHNLGYRHVNGEKRVALINFGCAVVVRGWRDSYVPFAGATWFASTSALTQLVGGRADETFEDDDEAYDALFDKRPWKSRRPRRWEDYDGAHEDDHNTWGRHVNVSAAFDLEGLVKSIALLEVPASFIFWKTSPAACDGSGGSGARTMA